VEFVFNEEKGLKEHKWRDVKVDDWPVKEIFRDKFLQKDGYVEIMVSYIL
jgi:sentrin-specific protease 1